MNVGRRRVFLEPLPPLRARDRDNVVALREQPRERELRRRAAFARGHALHALDDLEVLLEVLALKPRIVSPPVVGREVVHGRVAARQKAAAERTVCHETDPQLAADVEQAVFRIARPQRVFRL